MESARRQFLEGKMTEDEYRRKACIATILSLEDQDYYLEGQLGVGTFGVIVELVNTAFRQKVAAKIVLQEYVTESEMKLWPSIEHRNVLALNDIFYVPETFCYVFFMDKQSATLDKLLDDPSFNSDVDSFKRAMLWLRGISEGVKCLHGQKLAHLDLKLSNVLISESGVAKLCDFGSLTSTEGAADSYQSPFLYRAPDGLVSENGQQAVVHAFLYDIYSLGILSLELFTNQTLSKSFTDDWTDSNPSWTDVIYPRIFDILQVKKFKHLVRKTFKNAELKEETIQNMRDFVRGCISFNPKDRPSIDEVLQHKVFGGPKLFPRKKNDVWIKKASSKKVQFLLSLYVGCAASLQLPSSSHPVFESGDVQESNEHCTPDNPVDIKEDDFQDAKNQNPAKKSFRPVPGGRDIVPATKKKTNILKSMRDWFKGKWDKYVVAVPQDK